jgi:hypothetical protein
MIAAYRVALLCLCLVGSGCAQNAIFELALELPGWVPTAEQRARGDALYALVQLRSGTADALESPWSGNDPLAGFALALDEDRTPAVSVSVIGDEATAQAPLRMKIRFCQSPRCVALGDDHAPEARVEFARVFYVTHVTSHRFRLDALPTATTPYVEHVDKCAVRGCVDGDTSTFCHLDDGRHFCE